MTVVRRQVEQHALLAETLANLANQLRQVKVVAVDLVDHDHPAQAAIAGPLHHALGIEFNAGLGVDGDQRCICGGQSADGLAGKIRVTRRIGQIDAHPGLLVA
jgi:hypothetical protein